MAWTRVYDALARVEDLEPTDSGVLAFGAEPRAGGILVEKGRICWAVAPGMQRRLKDLLAARTSERGIDFDRIYERCLANGSLLGQTLVDEGWISASELEAALRTHSAESLVALCSNSGEPPSWTSRGSRGYLPRFTFRPIELLLEVVKLSAAEVQARARAELAKLDRADYRGAAFCCDSRYEVMVPVATSGELSVRELWSLGRWAMQLPLAARELGATPQFVLASRGTDTIAVWWRAELLFAVATEERSSVAAFVAQHLHEAG
ncbi:MAG: hypothetical protein KIT31_10960 [Deltaproteobacteria bacterium]|nr:hypothetical protein [Deltaproteobacteria bacterium]